jgi:hypothetical protein
MPLFLQDTYFELGIVRACKSTKLKPNSSNKLRIYDKCMFGIRLECTNVEITNDRRNECVALAQQAMIVTNDWGISYLEKDCGEATLYAICLHVHIAARLFHIITI